MLLRQSPRLAFLFYPTIAPRRKLCKKHYSRLDNHRNHANLPLFKQPNTLTIQDE